MRIALIVIGLVVTALGIALAIVAVRTGEPLGFELLVVYAIAIGMGATGVGLIAVGRQRDQ
jgi:hypothetical protein